MSMFKRLVPLLIVALVVASCGNEAKIEAGAPDEASLVVPGSGDSDGDDSGGNSEPLLVDDEERSDSDDEYVERDTDNTDNPVDKSDLDNGDLDADEDYDTGHDNGDGSNNKAKDSDSHDAPSPGEADPAQVISSQNDLNDPKPIVVSNLISNGDSTVTAYFSGASQPCAGAKATVIEDGDVVEILVEMGSTPEAAYTSCVAVVVDYRMDIQLEAPLAGRALEIHPDNKGNAEEGAIVVVSRNDLANLRSATIEDLTVADNGTTVKVWFTGGLKKCYGAKATMTETSTKVEVHLEIGNPPGAADCDDVGVQSVINIALAAPLGERLLVAHPDSSANTQPESPAERAAQEYIGLQVDEAEKRAKESGFAFRVVWIDGEALPVTEDYSESRINVAVEKGTVVESSIG